MPESLFKELALEVAAAEGGKKQVNIAQINEVLSISISILASWDNDKLQTLLDQYRPEPGEGV